MEIGFSFGANLGDRLANLSEAKRRILACPDTTPTGQSPVYETAPVDVRPEYRDLSYYNAVLIVDSPCPAATWLDRLARIESDMGRVRHEDRNAPRTIDIDILYADEAYIESGTLTVPHPRWAQRRFVVQPLADVRPDLVLPGCGQTVAEVLRTLPGVEGIRSVTDTW